MLIFDEFEGLERIMQVRILDTGRLAEPASARKSMGKADVEWRATVATTFGAEAEGPSSEQANAPSNTANLKISELLVAHLLREILPAGGHDEDGLAFDTWRGMLADAIAQEVGPRIDLLSSVKRPHGEQ